MYLLCREDEESVVRFNGRVRSYTLELKEGGLGESHTITRYGKKIFPCKKGFSACSTL